MSTTYNTHARDPDSGPDSPRPEPVDVRALEEAVLAAARAVAEEYAQLRVFAAYQNRTLDALSATVAELRKATGG